MKKTTVAALAAGIFAGAAALMATGCGSTQVAQQPAAAQPAATVATAQPAVAAPVAQTQIIDWKGAAFGEQIPQWARDAINNDYGAISRLPQFDGKIPVVRANTGKNLAALRAWVNNVDVKSGVATTLSTKVRAKAGGEGRGNVDGSYDRYAQELEANFSQVEINGLAQEMDYWTLTRKVGADGKPEDTYNFVVVYSIDREVFNQQIQQVLEKRKPQNDAEKKFEQDLEEEFAKLESM